MTAIDFRYVPTSGPIAGKDVLDQTERAIDELGAIMDATDETAAAALIAAQNAQATAQDAQTTAQGAATDAANALEASGTATSAAQTALATAQGAATTAANALDEASDASSTANAAEATANAANDTAQAASGTATAAQNTAQQAQNTAATALVTARQANGLFTTISGDDDANEVITPSKIYYNGQGAVDNLPGGYAGGYLEAYTDDGDATVLQVFYAPEGSPMYLRKGTSAEDEEGELTVTWGAWALSVPLSDRIDLDSSTTAASSAAVKEAYDAATVLKVLATATTFYVNGATGDDANDGLAPATAFATIQGAIDAVTARYILSNVTVTISVAAGTYAEGVITLREYLSGGTSLITIQGEDSTATIVSGGFSNNSASNYMLDKIGIVMRANQLQGVENAGTGVTELSNVLVDGTVSSPAMTSTRELCKVNSGSIRIRAGCTLTGAASTPPTDALFSSGAGRLEIRGNLVINGGAYRAIAFSHSGGNIWIDSTLTTVTGTATGQRYTASLNGVIYTHAGGPNVFPGTSAGTTDSGGQYT